MSKSYKILSEKYQTILEDDKEDIMAGLTSLDDETKAKEALTKVAEAIKQLNTSKYSSKMMRDPGGYRNTTFSINSTPHGYRMQITRFPKFEENLTRDAYRQEVIEIIRNTFQEIGSANNVKYRFRTVPDQLDVWYERPGSTARQTKFIKPVI